jgi:hypothetical protein
MTEHRTITQSSTFIILLRLSQSKNHKPKLNNLHQGKPAEMQEVWEKNTNHGIEAFLNHLCGRGKKNYNGKENRHTLECTSILHLTELEKTKLSDLS